MVSCQLDRGGLRKVPGAATAAYAGIDEQVCAQTTLPTMTITTVIPDP